MVNHMIAYFIENDVLMRKWSLSNSTDRCLEAFQVMVPYSLRNQVLNLAHDHLCSGHAGVHKTYLCGLMYFVWPDMKGKVAHHCQTCHTFQIVDTPKVIPPALLQPVSIRTESFEHIIVDCGVPLPKTPTSNYLLTLMCVATCTGTCKILHYIWHA